MQNEDEWHVFFGCEVSIQARNAAGLDYIITPRLQQSGTAAEIILDICSTVDKDKAGCFAMMIWMLWFNRNNCVWNELKESGTNLGIKARHFWSEWFSASKMQHQTHQAAPNMQETKWQKPAQGWYKCNVDAAFYREQNKTCYGWCLRDDGGRFVAAETLWMLGNFSIIEGEAIALLEAVKAMTNRGIYHVTFETDSKSVADAIHHLRIGSSEFSFIISHIKNILSCNPNFKVEFIKRQANMVAHTFARAAISWANRCTFEHLPICITALLNNEMR